jgi:hypothetical protein
LNQVERQKEPQNSDARKQSGRLDSNQRPPEFSCTARQPAGGGAVHKHKLFRNLLVFNPDQAIPMMEGSAGIVFENQGRNRISGNLRQLSVRYFEMWEQNAIASCLLDGSSGQRP